MTDPFAPLGGDGAERTPKAPEWQVVSPVPPDAPDAPSRHPKLGAPTERWLYRDRLTRLLLHVMRFDPKGGKTFRPLALYASTKTGALEWRWENVPAPRPLYGLDRLAERPDAPVLVCEGEKSADAATRLAPDHVAVTSLGGAQSPKRADWGVLRGRRVIIWPDADEPGSIYAEAVSALCREAGARSIAIVSPPPGVAEGWDAANAEEEGWTIEQTARHIQTGREMRNMTHTDDADSEVSDKPKPRKPRTPDVLISLAQHFDFWCSADGGRFVQIHTGEGCKNIPISSDAFKEVLTLKAHEITGQLPTNSALDAAIRYYGARALTSGTKKKAWMRFGQSRGRVYVDLADQAGRVVEIGPGGSRIISGEGLPFLASNMMQPMCEPDFDTCGESPIEELRQFLNVESDDDFRLIVGWLLLAYYGQGPFPILIVKAEPGSGKTTFGDRLASLVDPCRPMTFLMPEKIRDIIAIAQNRYAMIMDNVSFIDPGMSDNLCGMAYGTGVIHRKLHTDMGISAFSDPRPIVLNSIEDVARRHDLASRGLFVTIRPLPNEDRRPDDELAAEWDLARPRIMGALCAGVSSMLRNAEKTKVRSVGRMAFFEKMVTAAEPGLGWESGSIIAAYARNTVESQNDSFENDVLAVAIMDFVMQNRLEYWLGTPTELLNALDGVVSEKTRQQREWPKNPTSLGRSFDRCKKLLRAKGINAKLVKGLKRQYEFERISTEKLKTP